MNKVKLSRRQKIKTIKGNLCNEIGIHIEKNYTDLTLIKFEKTLEFIEFKFETDLELYLALAIIV